MTKFSLILQKILLSLFFALSLLFMISSLFVRTILPMDGSELAEIQRHTLFFFISFIFFAILFYIVISWLLKLKIEILFIIGVIFYLILGGYLIGHQNNILRHDALVVFQSASAIQQGHYESLTEVGGYLYKYPHQLGLVSFERIILAIMGNKVEYFFYLNLLLTLFSNFFLMKISQRLFRDEQTSKLTVLFSFVFLPNIFYILFVYGLTFGLFFAVTGFYCFICYIEKNSWKSFLLTVLFLTISNIIRSNYMILTIAILLVIALEYVIKRNGKTVLLGVSVIGLTLVGNRMIRMHYEQLANHTSLQGEPKIAWVAMGLNDTPRYNRLPGWYDAYVENVYNEHQGDYEKIEQASREQLVNRIKYMGEHPTYALRFFKTKFLSTWTDGLFASLWSGPLPKSLVEGQKVSGKWMTSIYEGGKLHKGLYHYATFLLMLFYISLPLAVLSLFKYIKEDTEQALLAFVPLLYLVGGVLFHLIWETKSQYAYPYLYLLIPIIAYGYNVFLRKSFHLKGLSIETTKAE